MNVKTAGIIQFYSSPPSTSNVKVFWWRSRLVNGTDCSTWVSWKSVRLKTGHLKINSHSSGENLSTTWRTLSGTCSRARPLSTTISNMCRKVTHVIAGKGKLHPVLHRKWSIWTGCHEVSESWMLSSQYDETLFLETSRPQLQLHLQMVQGEERDEPFLCSSLPARQSPQSLHLAPEQTGPKNYR